MRKTVNSISSFISRFKLFDIRKSGFTPTKSGFTLLEMLVVIGIISVLVSMGITSYATATKKARDARRKSDLKEIQHGLEQYFAVCGFNYPTPASDKFTAVNCPNPAITIVPTVPVDPRTTTPYPCPTGSCSNTAYEVCPPIVRVEGSTNYLLETEDCTDVNKSCCVRNQQ